MTKNLFCDLHVHSPYAAGTSKNMSLQSLSENAKIKGLEIIGTGDILQKDWLKQCKEKLIESNGIFKIENSQINFLLQVEVCCIDNIHHLIYLESFAEVEELKKKLMNYSKEIDRLWGGRPRIKLTGEQIAEEVEKVNGLIGPAHMFTPYFGIYGKFDSLSDCYKGMAEKDLFGELGLSADSRIADYIEELREINFLTNSDTHSPQPHRLGREFNQIEMNKGSFKEFKKALKDKKINLNVGMNPEEGKYHLTGCSSCHTIFTLGAAVTQQWKCSKCGGKIKKGVKDRAFELSGDKECIHPIFRPEYLYTVPLAELIQVALNERNVLNKKIKVLYDNLISKFDNEINILLEEPVVNIAEENKEIAKVIEVQRKGFVVFRPGAGGNYGKPFICYSKSEAEGKQLEIDEEIKKNQKSKTLFEFK